MGESNIGSTDVFLVKYEQSRTSPEWDEPIATSSADEAYSVAVDSSGNVYVTGSTKGALTGSNVGGYDIFLTKYDTNGTRRWITQFGTSANDYGTGVAGTY